MCLSLSWVRFFFKYSNAEIKAPVGHWKASATMQRGVTRTIPLVSLCGCFMSALLVWAATWKVFAFFMFLLLHEVELFGRYW